MYNRGPVAVRCPKCSFDHESQTTECLKCGIVFEKYLRAQELVPSAASPPAELSGDEPITPDEAQQELRYRIFAVPAAMIAARVLVAWTPGFVRLLSMWVHETGHATTAWFSGFSATPGPWFTPVSDERSIFVSLLVTACIGVGGYRVWRERRWPLVAAAAALLLFQIICTFQSVYRAQMLIIFGGDAGCFVLGTVLMATFYMRRDGVIYENALRWGFLPFGALSFMDAFKTWTGSEDDLPFGTQEGTLSDPSQLVQTYGWSIQLMMQRYVRLAEVCLVALGVLYVLGISDLRKLRRV